MLAILSDRVQSMEVPDHAIETFRRSEQPIWERAAARPERRAENAFFAALYPDFPYRRSSSKAELDAIDEKALKEWVRKAYTPDRAIVAIVGDVDLDQTERLARKWLGDWKPKKKPLEGEVKVIFSDKTKLEAPPPPPPPAPKATVIVLHREGAQVAELRLGCRLPLVTKPEQAALYDLLAELLQQDLYEKLTGEQGAGADISSHVELLLGGAAHLDLSAVVAGKKAALALAIVRARWDALAAGQWTDEAFERARRAAARRYELKFTTTGAVARAILSARKLGFGLDSADHYPEDLEAAAAQAAREALAHCNEATILSLVGDEPTLRSAVRTSW
jgi:predicted Zn-dependent peptidase